jgi:hypothetical protein
MKKVRIFRDWKPSVKCDLDYKDIKIVEDDSYDYAVLFNTPRPKLKNIPKENVIGFMWEPRSIRNPAPFVKYAQDNIGCYLIGDTKGLPEPFKEYHGFMADYNGYNIQPSNKHPMCIIASNNNYLVGHKKRHHLVKEILKTDMDIHIYGRGAERMYKDKRVKGGFQHFSDVYPQYHFDISIENSCEGSYITEKFTRPLVNETCPIYWGSNSIGKYFSDCYYTLSDNNNQAMQDIRKIYNNYMSYYNKKKDSILTTKDNLLNYNYLDFANYYFDNGKIENKVL